MRRKKQSHGFGDSADYPGTEVHAKTGQKGKTFSNGQAFPKRI